MSLQEMLEAIPKLSFAERQQLVRRAIEPDEELTSHEQAILDQRLDGFRPDPAAGIPAQALKRSVMERLKPE